MERVPFRDPTEEVGYALWRACNENDAVACKKVLDKQNNDTSVMTSVSPKMVNYNMSGGTPLDEAITHKNEALVSLLLPLGAVSFRHKSQFSRGEPWIWFQNTFVSTSGSSSSQNTPSHSTPSEITKEGKQRHHKEGKRAKEVQLKPNYENMSEPELELSLISLQNEILEINRIIASRKIETCVICLTGPRTHVLIPCGHKLMCEICAAQRMCSTCPICRANITSIIRIFS